MNDSYERLANAIILQAVKDYRNALKRLKKHPRNETALYTKIEVERFFRSDWCTELSSIDAEILIRKLKEEVI
ncbi:hypothetical protein [Gudongella oleilytica]|uniref:hypothetical protein n=1 Tax=Gudongella oleilytica TaxID=1582259 RepID=UPI000FF8AF83|nr:hypothetical protein [Gudongella oleilytica]